MSNIKDAIRRKLLGDSATKATPNPLPIPLEFDDSVDWSTSTVLTGPLFSCPGTVVDVVVPELPDRHKGPFFLVACRRVESEEMVLTLCEVAEPSPRALWVFRNDERVEARRLIDQMSKWHRSLDHLNAMVSKRKMPLH